MEEENRSRGSRAQKRQEKWFRLLRQVMAIYKCDLADPSYAAWSSPF